MKTNNKWLQQGQQSKITPAIQKIAKKLKRSNGLDTIFNIIQWNNKNIKYVKNTKWRTKQLRARTADEIIKSKKSSGCGDKSLVFAILARANNIPARLVEAIDNNWLLTKKTKGIYGHVFVDVYIDKKWRIVDPTMGTININYRWPLNKRFYEQR